jgi:tetratricopeptide (TPR) repeat protein
VRRAGAVLLLALLGAPVPAAAAPKGWYHRDWPRRQRIVLSERQAFPDSPLAHVRIATGGLGRPDGADVRVVDDAGREVLCAIAARGPGDLLEVVFPVEGASEWHVYYGNPSAPEPAKPFVPDRGLVLETRERAAGEPSDWPAMERILARSTKVFGGACWPQVFDAENPFGPSDDYVSEYRGFIMAPADGLYAFFTASDEASFLFVAGTLVAQWPGWHDAGKGAWATFKGTIELKAGLHPFRYVHVERAGGQVMAAYWKPPGVPKASVIPPTAFPGPRDAETVATEARDGPLAADFTFRPGDKWGLEDRVYTAVTFKASLSAPDAEYRFDFGDGTRGEGPIATHVYLLGGTYEATLSVTAGGARDTVTHTVRVSGEWTRFDREEPAVLERFARLVARAPGEALSAEALSRADFLLEQAGRTTERVALLRRAVERGAALKGPALHLAAMRLGELCRDLTRDLEGATFAFRRAAEIIDPPRRLAAEVSLAEALLELGGDTAAARKLLETARDPLSGRKDDTARRMWLRLGDALMIAGDGKAARQSYARALDLAGGAENAGRILRKAGAARAGLTHLGTGEWLRAAEDLREWEWQDPMDRFLGFHRIAKAKLLAGRGEPALAVRELEALLAGNPESEYADEALFLLAGLARDAGRTADADALMERLRHDYPWSPLGR